MSKVAYIIDETSLKAKPVTITTNDDNTVTISFDNDFTISRACSNDLKALSEKLRETLEEIDRWA